MEKMKKIVTLCSLFIVFLLLSTSLIPAVEIHAVRDEYKNKINDRNIGENSLISSVKEILQKNDGEKLTFKSLIELFDMDQFQINSDYGQTSIVILDIIIIFLFIYFLFKGIPNFINMFSSVLTSLASNVSSLLMFILTLLANSVSFILESMITLIIGLGKIIVNIVEFVGIAIFYILVGIVSVIALAIYGVIYSVVKIAGFIWNVFDVVVGLILDILRLIYEAIFQPAMIS